MNMEKIKERTLKNDLEERYKAVFERKKGEIKGFCQLRQIPDGYWLEEDFSEFLGEDVDVCVLKKMHHFLETMGIDTMLVETQKVEKKKKKTEAQIENPIRAYYKEIIKYKLLTREEEVELAKRIEQKDQEARETFINSNLRLVFSVAIKQRNNTASSRYDFMDLIGAGHIGLIKAVDKFDYRKGCKFSTYATRWIDGAIMEFISENSSDVAYINSTAYYEKIKPFNEAREAMRKELEREPTITELAERLNISEKEVEKRLLITSSTVSMNQKMGEDGKDSKIDLIEDPNALQPEEEAEKKGKSDVMEVVLHLLTDEQRQVINFRYGLNGGVGLTLEEVADVMGCSKSKVEKLEKAAFKRLQSPHIKEFLERHIGLKEES